MTPATPKQRFLKEEALAKRFQDLVDSEAFQRGAEAAMLSLQEAMVQEGDPEMGVKLVGAHRFLTLLRTIADKPQPLVKPSGYTLNHELK